MNYLCLKKTIIIIALMFNASNTYGFLKCKYGSDSNLTNVASGFFGKQVIQSVRKNLKEYYNLF